MWLKVTELLLDQDEIHKCKVDNKNNNTKRRNKHPSRMSTLATKTMVSTPPATTITKEPPTSTTLP
jgi:hypothetical protein